MLLTNGEIYTSYIEAANQTLRPQDERIALAFATVIERSVLEKLAQGVEMPEPFYWVYEAGTPGGYFIEVDRERKNGNYQDPTCWVEAPVYTDDQLRAYGAAQGLKALEDAAQIAEHENAADWSISGQIAKQIRALKGEA